MSEEVKVEQESTKKRILKWIAGILLLSGVIGGCFLIYRWWTKPTPEQVQQNEELKKTLRDQIREYKKKANNNRISLKKAKNKEAEFDFDTFDEYPKQPLIDPSDKELRELEEKLIEASREYNDSLKEGEAWTDSKKKQKKSLWERQKNGQWKVLTDKLDKSPVVWDRFDKIIKVFYQRFGEKKGIKIHEPRIDFRGFGHFYIKEEEVGSSSTEMAHTAAPEEEEGGIRCSEDGEIAHYPMEINFNQIYLLNHGTIGMNEFHPQDPEITKRKGVEIDFDHLTETIVHEIVHALQNVKNVDKSRKSIHLAANGTYPIINSQCESSGETDANNNLLHPDWAAEHTALTDELKQMMESSTEYREFKEWWQGSKI